MAYTSIHPIISTVDKSIKYICNPAKTDSQILIDSYGCAAETAALDFQLTLNQTKKMGGNKNKNLAYHLIQAFAPDDKLTYAQAHKIGIEFANKVLNNKYSYVIATHIDQNHIHNHIIFCAANNINYQKYNDCKRTYKRIRQISDKLCIENNLSIIKPEKSEQKQKDNIQKSNTNKTESFYKNLSQKDNIYKKIIDVNSEKVKNNKGLEIWAKRQNLKSMAKLLSYLQEVGLDSYEDFNAKYSVAKGSYQSNLKEIKKVESEINKLMEILKYATDFTNYKSINDDFRNARNQENFFMSHESELIIFNTAKRKLQEYNVPLDRIRLSKLKNELYLLKQKKNDLYIKFKDVKAEYNKVNTIKQNIENFLNQDSLEQEEHNKNNPNQSL